MELSYIITNFVVMTENERFYQFLLKNHEMLTLMFTHHIPQGRPLPDSYREFLYEQYKVFYNGALEGISVDPIPTEQPIQVDLFEEQKQENK